ncbi:MAG TPA: glycosyltransferase family 4 protein [Bryobacteraceae bacterium]|jgi:glycosyltransferase involved in cell wall biosynthesis|nr:glycosyltransferase family 4 protein [Bryobacteraceae bacterium]
MRVLYLNPCGQMGGAETSLLEILRSMRAAVPDWDLRLVLGEDGPLAGRAREQGVRVSVVQFPRALARAGDVSPRGLRALMSLAASAGGAVLYGSKLAAAIGRIAPDVIHTNGLKMHVLGAWSGPKGTPVVWHIHDYVGSRRLMGRLLRRFSKRCAAAIVNSHSVEADLNALMPGIKKTVIYNAIDVEKFSPAGERMDLDRACGLPTPPAGTIRVGLVGTFARWKGHKVFLQALAQLRCRVPVRGYVVGGPIYQTSGSQWTLEELKREVEQLGLTGRVGFTGILDNPAAAIRSLDIVVHASTQPEPFGMVIVEAMGCGKPVIVSQAGGALELIEDGRTALGHPPGDAPALAFAIERLAVDEPLRARLGAAGRAEAVKRFDGSRLARELTGLYLACRDVSGDGAALLASHLSR